jgi:hypothetical protein
MDDRKPAWMRWGGVALGLVAAVLIALWLKDMLVSDGPVRKPTIQQITLIKPPPPPPKPPEEKPPEPEVKEEVKLDEPQPTPEQQAEAPPPGPDLGVDAEGTGSGDGFGLVGKKGGSELIGGGGGNPWAWYDALVNGGDGVPGRAGAREGAQEQELQGDREGVDRQQRAGDARSPGGQHGRCPGGRGVEGGVEGHACHARWPASRYAATDENPRDFARMKVNKRTTVMTIRMKLLAMAVAAARRAVRLPRLEMIALKLKCCTKPR